MKTKTNLLRTILCLFMGVALLTSCSKDEDENTKGQQGQMADIVFFEEQIALPPALESQTDPHAQQLVGEVQMVSSFGLYAGFTQVPPGAEVSHEPIEANGNIGGRPANVLADYTVYSYSYGEGTIAYQFSTQNGMDVVEIFFSTPETNGYVKYMEIRQSLDGKNGTMEFFGLENGIYLMKWTWQINPDGSILINYTAGTSYSYELFYNPDMSGYLKFFTDGTLNTEWNWNADGSGNWTNYADNTSGSW